MTAEDVTEHYKTHPTLTGREILLNPPLNLMVVVEVDGLFDTAGIFKSIGYNPSGADTVYEIRFEGGETVSVHGGGLDSLRVRVLSGFSH